MLFCLLLLSDAYWMGVIMMEYPIRVLQVVTTMNRGGLETMLMNYYRNINHEKVQFDFLVHREEDSDYDQEILSLCGKIYHISKLNPLSSQYRADLDDFFREHQDYKIVHSHLDCMAGIPLKYAKSNGVPVCIAHSHNSNQTKDIKYLLKIYYKKKIKEYADYLFACSQEAGEWMFNTNDFKVLNNAIDAKKYSFNAVIRKDKRKEFNIFDDSIMIGHVGRFFPQKNHSFLIDIFNDFHSINPNSYLMLIGEGDLKASIIEKVKELHLEDYVIFTGLRSDVNELLQAMDVFLFPSLYEGLPVSIVEAQAAGLPCLISDKVPIECKKTDLVYQINLNDPVDVWADKVNELSHIQRRDTYEDIKNAGFDIIENAKWLENFYLDMYKKAIGEE